jgi:ribonuclease-3
MSRHGHYESDPELAIALRESLGHQFNDVSLLAQALTHASLGGSRHSNERLEFLGDRVLGLVVAEALFATFDGASEGELAVRLNSLVRQETCAAIARQIALGSFIRMARSESETGGRDKPALLADAIEAVIGALYLDGGMTSAHAFILCYWGPLIAAGSQMIRDAKTVLQEWAQSEGRGVPQYLLLARSGPDHAPDFTVEVRVRDCEPVIGHGKAKRLAEQAAAETFLMKAGIWQAGGVAK